MQKLTACELFCKMNWVIEDEAVVDCNDKQREVEGDFVATEE